MISHMRIVQVFGKCVGTCFFFGCIRERIVFVGGGRIAGRANRMLRLLARIHKRQAHRKPGQRQKHNDAVKFAIAQYGLQSIHERAQK